MSRHLGPITPLVLDLALFTGTPAAMAPDTACIEIAQYYVTTVALEATLIGNVS